MTTNRPLRVFLCHSSNDKPAVRELYQKLRAEPWISPWLDEEELYPGDDWDLAIQKAVEESDVVLVCLSNGSINKRGYVQRELRFALDIALEMPEEEIFVIPLRLEECTPPRSLRDWQYADYFEGQRERGLKRLLISLRRRADSLGVRAGVSVFNPKEKPLNGNEPDAQKSELAKVITSPSSQDSGLTYENIITLSNGMEFMYVPAGRFLMGSEADNINAGEDEKPQHFVDIPYDYWMARFPVTNELYNTYAKSKGIKHPVKAWEKKKDHPVVRVLWTEAIAYCQWLNDLLKPELPSGLVLRLPTEAEWEKAARGVDGREYPWGNTFDKNKCNGADGGVGGTTPVGYYSPQGDSPYGCTDMAGNVREWTHSLNRAYPYKANDGREDEKVSGIRVVRGGSFSYLVMDVRCAFRKPVDTSFFINHLGFRVVASPFLS